MQNMVNSSLFLLGAYRSQGVAVDITHGGKSRRDVKLTIHPI